MFIFDISAIEEAKPIIVQCDCWNGGKCIYSKNDTRICLCTQGKLGEYIFYIPGQMAPTLERRFLFGV